MTVTLMVWLWSAGVLTVFVAVVLWLLRPHPDLLIDSLIERNRATARPGMGTPDQTVMDAVGADRWRDVMRAQRRQRQKAQVHRRHLRVVRREEKTG